MRKNKNGIWTNLYIWAALCAVMGITVCFSILFLFSFILYSFTDIVKSFTVFSIASLSAGSFCGGYLCGLFRRNKGLYEGAFCGFLIYVILLVIGGVWLHSFAAVMSVKKLLLCVVTSAAGGVTGVNHKRPRRI